MGSREFHIEGRLYQHVKGHWESFPTSSSPNTIAHVSIAPSCGPSSPKKNQLLLAATPSIRGGPTKVLVDDLASPLFRHKLTRQVAKDEEIFILQWSYKSQAFGLKCHNHADADHFSSVLNECKAAAPAANSNSNSSPEVNGKACLLYTSPSPRD